MRPLALAVVALALLLPAHEALADWPNNPAQSVGIQVGPGNTNNYYPPVVVPDGQGGAIVAWSDDRTGTFDVYAQHLSAAGVPLWTAGGLTVRGGSGNQTDVVGVADGAGGVILAFSDDAGGLAKDVRLQRLSASGTLLWPPYLVGPYFANQQPTSATTLSNGNVCVVVIDDTWGNYDIFDLVCPPAGPPGGLIGVCTAGGYQYAPAVVPDAAGGAFLMWNDFRPGPLGNNVFAQRVNVAGSPLWAADGIPVSTTNHGDNGVAGVTDGFGGCVVLWNDFDGAYRQVHAEQLAATGISVMGDVPLTSGNEHFVSEALPDGLGGFYLGTSFYGVTYAAELRRFSVGASLVWGPITFSVYGLSSEPTLAADGDGGVFVGWTDAQNLGAYFDIFVQQVSPEGGFIGSYSPTPLCTAPNYQYSPRMASDGRGGVIAAWLDARDESTNSWDLYANRVARFGKIGAPEAKIVSVKDVPNDQGGQVTVRWDRSYLDKATNQQISYYWLWREVPVHAAQAALANGAMLWREEAAIAARGETGAAHAAGEPPPAGRRLIRPASTTAGTGYWEYVGQQTAQGFPSYSMTTSTEGDSIGGSNPRTKFMIEAYAYNAHWESPADSGYSVDNIPPSVPAPFTGQYATGVTHLHWNPNSEPDLAGYELYRGTSVAFTPGPANFVTAKPDTGYADVAGAPFVYKLLAVDAHGNKSPVATLVPTGALGVDEPAPAVLALSRPSPNPAQGSIALRFSLPAAGPARLAIHDAQGRLVRLLASGECTAGEHALTWDRLDGGGAHVAAGLYFVRLQAAGRVLTQRVAVID